MNNSRLLKSRFRSGYYIQLWLQTLFAIVLPIVGLYLTREVNLTSKLTMIFTISILVVIAIPILFALKYLYHIELYENSIKIIKLTNSKDFPCYPPVMFCMVK